MACNDSTISWISQRGARALRPSLPYFALHAAGCANGVWTPENNGGFVSMAIAENKLSFAPAMLERLAACRTIDAETGAYDDMRGRRAFRTEFARMVNRTMLNGSVSVDPTQLCVSSGCGAAIMQLSMLLLDPGDGVLLPTPTYAALYSDIQMLAYATVIDVPTEATGFRLTREVLDAAIAESHTKGIRVRMLFLINPNNPLGIVYSERELQLARAFCSEHGLHLVVDEIYANSVYIPAGDVNDSRKSFCSIVELCARDAVFPTAGLGTGDGRADTHRFLGNTVHVLWGMSKDWAMSGFRVGVIYSHNAELLAALDNTNYFTSK